MTDNKKNKISLPSAAASMVLPEEVGEISRREMLKTGMSVTGYVSLGQLLSPMIGSQRAHGQANPYLPQKKLVWISMDGGWDILEVTDPKVSSTSGIDMSYSWGDANRLAGSSEKIGRWLSGISGLGTDVIVIRGLAMGTTSHTAGPVYMDTGVLSNNGVVNAASIPAIVASESEATIPVIQLNGGMLPQTDRGLLKPVSTVRAQNLDLYRSLYPQTDDEIDRRIKMLDYLKNSITRLKDTAGANDRLTAVESAEAKIRGQIETNLSEKLSLSRGDLSPFAGNVARNMQDNSSTWALALKLIKNDLVTSVTMGVGGFDTHTTQETRLQPILENFDTNLTAFIQELKKADLLDSTLIVVYSDFGRTPKINGSNGRDHWPVGGALMIGGGLEGGKVVGGTDDNLQAQSINPDTGEVQKNGTQLNPTHIGGSVLSLVLSSAYLQYRSYLTALPILTKLKGS